MVPSAGVVFHVKHFVLARQIVRAAGGQGDAGVRARQGEQRALWRVVFFAQ